MNSFKELFLLSPDIHYLNFGSFGACPKPIFDNYQEWQRLLEYEPFQFINVEGAKNLANSREALAKFVGVADKDDVVFITNPTLAVNLIAKNLDLKEGDEILTTDLEYGACDRTWDLYCQKNKAVYKKQKIELSITTKERFIDNFFEGLTNKTRAIFISHITSSTALILPVKEIVEIAKSKGVVTIVDGAHAAGQIPLDIEDIGAYFYTSACHKWMLAPKGCSFLYASKAAQEWLGEPVIVSWGYNAIKPSGSRFLDYNQMIGTRDFSAFLTVPTITKFLEEHRWGEVSTSCRKLVLDNAERFFGLLESTPLSPLNEDWIGQMLSIPIKTTSPETLQRTLFTRYYIEVPIMPRGNDVYLRYSINAFNEQGDLDALFDALKELKKEGGLLL